MDLHPRPRLQRSRKSLTPLGRLVPSKLFTPERDHAKSRDLRSLSVSTEEKFALSIWPLQPVASAHGAPLDHHLLLNLWIAAALFLLAHIALLAGILLRERSSSPRDIWRLEYIPVTLLSLVFLLLAARAERLWAASRYTGPSPTALQIEVTGVQFAWYFRYPGTDATFGLTHPELVAPGEGNPLGLEPSDPHSADDFVTSELVLPQGREVDLRLHAQDVIHGFAVPAMRLKQNAVPGQTVHIHFTPTRIGTYAVLCTQLCGTGHYHMNANLRVVTQDEYTRWLATHARAPAQ